MKDFLGLNKQYLVSNYLYFKKQTNLTKLFLFFIAMIAKNTNIAQKFHKIIWCKKSSSAKFDYQHKIVNLHYFEVFL